MYNQCSSCSALNKGLPIALLYIIGGLVGVFVCDVIINKLKVIDVVSSVHIPNHNPSPKIAIKPMSRSSLTEHDITITFEILGGSFFTMILQFYILAVVSALHVIFSPILIIGMLKKSWSLGLKFWIVFKIIAKVLTTVVVLVLLRFFLEITFLLIFIWLTCEFVDLIFFWVINDIRKEVTGTMIQSGPVLKQLQLQDVVVPNGILERFVKYIEDNNGLSKVGLYRIPGDENVVQIILTKLTKNPSLGLGSTLPVQDVAAALMELVSKRLAPPVIPLEKFDEIGQSLGQDRQGNRLEQIKIFLWGLPPANFAALQILFMHLADVSAESQVNKMDSNNLAICWSPIIFPARITAPDIPFGILLKDLTRTMIDESQLFFGEPIEEGNMV